MTWTPQTNTTRNDLLTAEQLGRLKGAEYGWLMWIGVTGEWVDTPNPLWLGDTTMRAKPAHHPEYLRALADVEGWVRDLRTETRPFSTPLEPGIDVGLLSVLTLIASLREGGE